jgi:hypothetical protein
MSSSVPLLPVSIEQLAATIRQMSLADQQRLLALVPELRYAATQLLSQTPDELTAVERLRTEAAQTFAGQRLTLDELFIGDLTLGQYLALPDAERAHLWDAWAGVDLDRLEERGAHPDAVPAR